MISIAGSDLIFPAQTITTTTYGAWLPVGVWHGFQPSGAVLDAVITGAVGNPNVLLVWQISDDQINIFDRDTDPEGLINWAFQERVFTIHGGKAYGRLACKFQWTDPSTGGGNASSSSGQSSVSSSSGGGSSLTLSAALCGSTSG